MKSSVASSPLLPILTGVGAIALIFGTLTNGGTEDANAEPTSSSSELGGGATDPNAGPPVDVPAEVPAESPAAPIVAGKVFAAGKPGTVGGLKLSVAKVTAKGATVTVGKKSYSLTTKKAAKIGKYTVTVTKVNPAAKRAAISVEGG